MQLNKRKSLSVASKIALAATALIGTQAHSQTNTQEDEWEFVGSILTYSEPDRVSAVETILTAEKSFYDTAKLKYKVVLDSLTGASANGAIVQKQAQTFTRPSGNGRYSVAPGETPLDDTFKDTRAQLNVNWSDNWKPDWTYTLGTNLSKEYDYQSLAVSGEIAKSFDRKNTTLSGGLSFSSDSVTPEGGRPLGFSPMVIDEGQFLEEEDFDEAFSLTRISGDGSIETSELLLGWTQILNRRALFQINYSYADTSGYLTDPFKVLSVIDDTATTQDYIYEKRPDTRTQHTVYAMTKYHLEESIVDFSYRYLTDDWDIESHTVDFKWHLFSNEGSFIEPHVRFYRQAAANFYNPYLVDGQVLPEFSSADYRLGEMDAMTIGLKYGFRLDSGSRAEIRAEYYKQSPKAKQAEVISAVEELDIYPEVDAFTLQFTYYF